MELMTFTEKFNQLYAARRLSQVKLAEALDNKVSQGTVGNWLHGTYPRLHEAWMLAQFFGVPLDYLADDSLDEIPQPIESTLSDDDRAILEAYRDLRLKHGLKLGEALIRLSKDLEKSKQTPTVEGDQGNNGHQKRRG